MTGKFTTALLSGLIAIGGASAAIAAGVPRPLSGSVQGYVGSGLPVPIRAKGTAMDASCLPQGAIPGVKAKAGAMITTYPSNGAIKMQPSQFTLRGPGNPFGAKVIGVMTQNPVALQVRTNFIIKAPAAKFAGKLLQRHSGGVIPAPLGGAGGRTGPNTVSWCPGYTATVAAGTNPGCNNPGQHAAVHLHTCGTITLPNAPGCPGPNYQDVVIPGFMKYQRTGKMLGGPSAATLGGTVDVAVGAPGGGAFFLKGTPPPTAVAGQSFGNYFQKNLGKGPQAAPVNINGCGIITFVGPVINSMALSNRTTGSFGGPLTQGMLTIKADTGIGYEEFMIAGYDNRTAMGVGKLSLVGGAVSDRSLTGENANRSFVFLDVPEPGAIAAAGVALLVLAACHQWVRRSR
jgi:hypothetical protein